MNSYQRDFFGTDPGTCKLPSHSSLSFLSTLVMPLILGGFIMALAV